jgi:hypothetical protein
MTSTLGSPPKFSLIFNNLFTRGKASPGSRTSSHVQLGTENKHLGHDLGKLYDFHQD